jgi:hypothetical protein
MKKTFISRGAFSSIRGSNRFSFISAIPKRGGPDIPGLMRRALINDGVTKYAIKAYFLISIINVLLSISHAAVVPLSLSFHCRKSL